MTLADYLAKNYLSADKSSKKRKRKPASSGLLIADDNDDLSLPSASNPDADDEFSPVVVSDARSGNRTTRWKTYGATAPSNAEQAAADAILADAAAEKTSRTREDEDAPAVVGEEGEAYDGPTMASGAMAGLQTAAQVTAALKRKEKLEKKAMQEMGMDPEGKAQETVYRDASGRRIDVAMKRAEMRRKAEEEERRKMEEKEGALGEVQRREKAERKKELENVRVKGVARYADDEDLNEELKGKGRWNDPMAAMVGTETKGKKGRRKKVYEGAAEPNRYGIKPGYRWDGVDRSNGFERKWFAARNKKQDRKDLEYAWEMDE
ncbi:Pre-mRNA-splicing factor cwc26 [Sphaceloma murrayae]|uniref:Pre-mRNA-splicing factor cwc26 n=1 Tax=Sphaceloma murrayae TaxID=2082308 RepID=A0A2K1QLK4_9PEZI|nr:Pre-mRNA-splicing factor cwc26 [Sphaceloma murrayae]